MADTSDSIRVRYPRPTPSEAEPASATTGFFTGVAGQLLLYTVGLRRCCRCYCFRLMIAEHRNTWLTGRAGAAELASLAAQSMPNHHVTPEFSRRVPQPGLHSVRSPPTWDSNASRSLFPRSRSKERLSMDVPDQPAVLLIFDTLGHFTTSEQRNIKLTFKPELTPYDEMEVIVSEGTLRRFLVQQFGAIVLQRVSCRC